MVNKKPKKKWSWSYSRYALHKQCAFKYKCQYVDKIPQPPNPYMQRGNEYHKLGENYLLHKINEVPAEYHYFSDDMRYMRKQGATPEKQYTFDSKWKLTGWFESDAWLRLKIDIKLALNKSGTRVKLTDLKTGKVRKGDYSDQLDLYATTVFTVEPKVKEIVNDLWFLDYGEVLDHESDPTIKEVYLSKDAPSMRKVWEKRAKVIQKDIVYPCRKSWLCPYCHYRKSNGGCCENG